MPRVRSRIALDFAVGLTAVALVPAAWGRLAECDPHLRGLE